MTQKSFRIAVMAVIINSQNQFLIGSSPRDGGYKLPQGGLEPNEDARTGIKRELNEELGILLTDDDILHIPPDKVRYFYPSEDPYYIYKGQELTIVKIRFNDSWELIPQDDEFDELHWITPSELCKYDIGFRIEAYTKAIELCGLL